MNPGASTQRRFEIPPGFVRPGWLCTRCELRVEGIPEHVDGTQRCNHCKKWFAEYVPALDPEPEMHQLTSEEAKANRKCEQFVTKEQAADLFAQARADLDAVEPYDPKRARQQAMQQREPEPSPEDY